MLCRQYCNICIYKVSIYNTIIIYNHLYIIKGQFQTICVLANGKDQNPTCLIPVTCSVFKPITIPMVSLVCSHNKTLCDLITTYNTHIFIGQTLTKMAPPVFFSGNCELSLFDIHVQKSKSMSTKVSSLFTAQRTTTYIDFMHIYGISAYYFLYIEQLVSCGHINQSIK